MQPLFLRILALEDDLQTYRDLITSPSLSADERERLNEEIAITQDSLDACQKSYESGQTMSIDGVPPLPKKPPSADLHYHLRYQAAS